MAKVLFILMFSTLSVFAQDDDWQSKGEQVFSTLGCSSCHGSVAEGTSFAPKLAGSSTEYLVEQLNNFQNGTRENTTMRAMSQLAKGYETIISAWVASLDTGEF